MESELELALRISPRSPKINKEWHNLEQSANFQFRFDNLPFNISGLCRLRGRAEGNQT
jgi:hypothetical protein